MGTALVRKPAEKSSTEKLYCSECKKTTGHSKKNGNFVCSCGSIKKPVGAFEAKLMEVLGLIMESDEPVFFKHDGLKKKTQAGAHRFDDGTEFTQTPYDGKWLSKKKQGQLSS